MCPFFFKRKKRETICYVLIRITSNSLITRCYVLIWIISNNLIRRLIDLDMRF